MRLGRCKEAVTVDRYGVGPWRVAFEGHGDAGPIGAVARIIDSEPGACNNAVSTPDGGSDARVVFVRCVDAEGSLADRPFSVLFVN